LKSLLLRTLTVVVASVGLAACNSAAGTDASARPVECAGPATAATPKPIEPLPQPTPKLPTSFADTSGETVTVTDVDRILALDTYGTLASTVYALGLGDHLVGRDISTGIPALQDLPVVTHNGHQLNAEAILDLNPSVILTDYTIGPLEVQLQLRDAGIPIVILSDQRTRDTTVPQIKAVAQVLGVPAAGDVLAARFEKDLAATNAHIAELVGDTPGPRMVFLYMRGNAGVYYWFGKGSGAADLIAGLRGVDVATEVGVEGERPLNAEGLVSSAPDMFLMMSEGLESVGGVDGLVDVPGVGDTEAGEKRCVVDMSDFLILSFGPNYPATLSSLADAIYGRQ
jgi:iron complex transport system substrate-binding protein